MPTNLMIGDLSDVAHILELQQSRVKHINFINQIKKNSDTPKGKETKSQLNKTNLEPNRECANYSAPE